MSTEDKDYAEDMRDDLRRVIDSYSGMSISQTIGILEMMKQELWDRLRECDHPDAQK